MLNRYSQSNRCKLLLDLASKSHEDTTNQILIHGILPKLNVMNNDNEIVENVNIVSLSNNV